MNGAQITLDFDAAQRDRDAGIKRVTVNNRRFIDQARNVARELLSTRGTITADDVRAECAARGITPSHYNAWGPLFMPPEFTWTGEYRKSANVKGHGNLQRVWRSAR